jgi:hypothetical protein
MDTRQNFNSERVSMDKKVSGEASIPLTFALKRQRKEAFRSYIFTIKKKYLAAIQNISPEYF